MKILVLSEAENHFGKLLDLIGREPVQISKKGQNVAIVLSVEEFTRLSILEDKLLAIKAEKAKEDGFLGISESEGLLRDIIDA